MQIDMLLLSLHSLLTQNLLELRLDTAIEEGFIHLGHHDTKSQYLNMQDCFRFLQIESHLRRVSNFDIV